VEVNTKCAAQPLGRLLVPLHLLSQKLVLAICSMGLEKP
jgi:hypothetical protein